MGGPRGRLISVPDRAKAIELIKEAREDVERLTKVQNYKASQEQLTVICQKIFLRDWEGMLDRLKALSDNPDDTPSSNILKLFEWLRSDDFKWIDELNSLISSEWVS